MPGMDLFFPPNRKRLPFKHNFIHVGLNMHSFIYSYYPLGNKLRLGSTGHLLKKSGETGLLANILIKRAK